MRLRSLRARLLLATLAGLLLLPLAFAWLIHRGVRDALLEAFDARLERAADDIAEELLCLPSGELAVDVEDVEESVAGLEGASILARRADGEVLLSVGEALAPMPARLDAAAEWLELRLASGQPARGWRQARVPGRISPDGYRRLLWWRAPEALRQLATALCDGEPLVDARWETPQGVILSVISDHDDDREDDDDEDDEDDDEDDEEWDRRRPRQVLYLRSQPPALLRVWEEDAQLDARLDELRSGLAIEGFEVEAAWRWSETRFDGPSRSGIGLEGEDGQGWRILLDSGERLEAWDWSVIFEAERPWEFSPEALQRAFEPVELIVAASTAELDARLAALQTWVALGSLLICGLAVGLAGLIAKRALAPLDALASEIAALRPDDLNARLASRGWPEELAPVAARIDELLGRLAGALEQERRFAADMAHELRTPVAGLRTLAEVTLRGERSAAEYRASLEEARGVCGELQGMVEAMLLLERLEAGREPLELEPVDLEAELARAWEPLAERARARGLRREGGLSGPAFVEADGRLAQVVLTNALENAVSYADEGGWLRWGWRDGVLELSNSGATVSPAEAPRVFERLWRGDGSRTGSHAGLGLALLRRAMEAQGGSAEVAVSKAGEFCLRLRWSPLPTASAEEG